MTFHVAAVILAGGASTRMGRPKAEILWRGRRWIDHLIDHARSSHCDPIVVVQGAHRFSAGGGVRIAINPDWGRGQLSSLHSGIQAVQNERPHFPTGVLVLTVDRPHLRAETLAALVAAHGRDPLAIWQPGTAGRRGHPILYPWDVAQQLLQLPTTATARDLLGSDPTVSRRKSIEVDDPAIFANLDSPEDLGDLPD